MTEPSKDRRLTTSGPSTSGPRSWSALLGPELWSLIETLGSPPRTVQPIGRLASVVSARAAFRVVLADGRVLKARRLESAARAETLVEIWPLIIDLPFSRGLARNGAAVLETWIEGDPLTPEHATSERLEEAGDLLGQLHRRVLPTSLAGRSPLPARLLSKLERRLGVLASRGLLSGPQTAILLDEARRHLPRRLESGLIHHDFCAENLILTGQGRLYAIDNEDMRVGALDADLARCFLRWSMSTRARDAFLRGYGRHRRAERYQAHAAFWSIWALVGAAEFRAARELPTEDLVARLRR